MTNELSQPRYLFLYLDTFDMDETYYLGGYHPIHIGDTFKDGRYTVVHKLGTGTFSSVWLANDHIAKTYMALKILAVDASKWSGNFQSVDEELEVLSRVRDNADETESDFVLCLLGHFLHTGPNGKHQCIVTELLRSPLLRRKGFFKGYHGPSGDW